MTTETSKMLNRRTFIKSAAVAAVGAGALPGFIGNAMATTRARHHVVIVGGGHNALVAAGMREAAR